MSWVQWGVLPVYNKTGKSILYSSCNSGNWGQLFHFSISGHLCRFGDGKWKCWTAPWQAILFLYFFQTVAKTYTCKLALLRFLAQFANLYILTKSEEICTLPASLSWTKPSEIHIVCLQAISQGQHHTQFISLNWTEIAFRVCLEMCLLALTNMTEQFSADGSIYWRSELVRDYMTGMGYLVFLGLTLTRRGVWRNRIKLKKERINLVTIGFWNHLLSETYVSS